MAETMAEKKVSKAFETYKAFADQVREATPHNINGKPIITVSSLKPSTQKNGDQVFYLNSKSDESISFTISPTGKLKSATYIDKEAEKGEKAKFVAKDFDKLASCVKDKALAEMASKLDWTKAAAKEASEQEVEAEEPPFEA